MFFHESTLNQLSFSQINYEYTVNFANSHWIHFFSPNYYEITICYANIRRIHYLLREFTLNPRFFAKHYGLTFCYAISLWMNYLFHDFTMNTLSASRIYYGFTICYANIRRIHYLLRDFTMNTLSAFRIHLESTIFFVISIWIHYLLRDFSLNSFFFFRIHYLFFEFTLNPRSLAKPLWFRLEITLKSLEIHHLFRECPMDSLSASRFLFEFILFFRIHYLFCEFTLNPHLCQTTMISI